MSGKKRAVASRDIDIKEVKKISKDRNCTVNDVLSAFISNGMYAYFSRNAGMHEDLGDGQVPKQINFGMPFSLRPAVKDLRDTNFENMLGLMG